MADMISLFKDETVMDTPLNVVMINAFGKEEDGVDNNGVSLTLFPHFGPPSMNLVQMGKRRELPS